MFRSCVVLFAVLGLASPVPAASWAEAMFEDLSKDFGSVPRGPTLTHHFRFTNNTGRRVHVAGARVSCGCVSTAILEQNLAPGQSTAVLATMDTRRFYGIKNVTIYVQFDQPQWEEVRLWVQANGRDDITVTPDAFSLGKVKRGSSPSASVTVSLMGNNQWSILELHRESSYLQASLKEVRRDVTEVNYLVTVAIRPDTPVGKWYSDIWLQTNNPSLAKIRIPLTVEIESALSITPAAVNLGQIKPGGEAERKLIVRGIRPFRVTKVEGTDEQLRVQDSADEAKPIHVLTITLKPTQSGEINRTLRVVTDLSGDGEIEFQAKAYIVPE
jgi:hypothetical protein